MKKKKNLIKNVILYFKFVIIVINLFLKYLEYNYNCKKIKNGLYKNNSYQFFNPSNLYFNISLNFSI